MSKILSLFLCLIAFNVTFSQGNIDSLRDQFYNDQLSLKIRLSACAELESSYISEKIDSVLFYNQEALRISEEANNDSLIIHTSVNFATNLSFMSKYEQAIIVLRSAEDRAKKTSNESGLADIYTILGQALDRKGNPAKGLLVLQKAERLYQKVKNVSGQANVIYEMGSINLVQGKYEEAANQFEKAKILFEEEGDFQNVIYCIGSIGTAVLDANPKRALQNFKEVIILADSLEAYTISAKAYDEIGRIYFKQGQIKASESSFNKSLSIYQKLNIETGMHSVQKNLGHLYLQNGQYHKSVQLCEDAHQFFKKNQYLFQNKESCECLYKAYAAQGKYVKAFQYLQESNSLHDSISSSEKKEELAEIKLRYEFENEKAVIALEQAQKETEMLFKNRITQTIAGALGLIALLVFGFFWNTRRKNKIITEQKTQLEKLNQSKDLIFAIIGHDLRKPAIAFRGLMKKINYLLRKKEFETLNALGGAVEENAMALNKLTDNLLNWALVERNVMPYNPVKVSVAEVGSDVISIFQGTADGKDLQIINKISNDVTVHADHNAFSTILTNLVDNAIKYTPEGGNIKLEAHVEGDQVKISVIDSGVGMDSKKLKDVFLLKTDKSKSGTQGEKGTGLGLYLIKELAAINKGTIQVKSELHKGTTFDLIMPKD